MIIKDIFPGDNESLSPEIREMLSEVMIPISFAVRNSTEPVIWALEPLLSEAEKLEESIKSNFSDFENTLAKIERSAADYAETRGYTLSEEDTGISHVFMAKNGIKPISELPVLLSEENYDEDSAFDFYYDGIIAYGIVKDGIVISAASTNPEEQDEMNPFHGCTEIGVETMANHRGNGYAAMCLSSLAAHLEAQGEKIIYVCAENNLPSIRTAEKSDFFKEGIMYFCVCRSKD